MNPNTNKLEALPRDVVPDEKKGWRRFDIGDVVEVQGYKFRILAVDVAKQTIKLKVLPNEPS